MLERLFEARAKEADLDWVVIDFTIIRAHQYASGAKIWPALVQALIGLHERIRHVIAKAVARMEIRASRSS